ncbi:MAG TPA: caspase family protein [Leptolyngbyaceae cyanobacterium M65_K2018_010]|nr:caspase family protein [Leptolyngbyaceae cyanobacterium M65_K2018_010]
MATHWPVVVGINQYQFLQPLMYAQFDALELKDFLVEEAGLPAAQCALLTDVSPMLYEGSAFPGREVILQRLSQTVELAQPEDTIWFFFSGYGVHYEGQDYLLPIDADPSRIAQTGILVETLFKVLSQGKMSQALVILDMNRPQAALSAARLGQQSLELAKGFSIPLLLSCRPDEFSQETLAVRHGLFSEAMIEGLRFHGCLTLSQLVDYLTRRVPELCRFHFRPEQHPVAAIPPEQKFMLLVPPSAAGLLPSQELPYTGGPMTLVPPLEAIPTPTVGADSLAVVGEEADSTVASDGSGSEVPSELPPMGFEPPTLPSPTVPPPPTPAPAKEAEAAVSIPRPTEGIGRVAGWQWSLVAAAGLLLLGLLAQNRTVLWGNGSPTPEVPEVAASDAEAPPAANPEPSSEASSAPEDNAPALFPGRTMDPAAALEQARRALAEKKFGAALTWLSQIPEDQRPEDYATLLAQAQAGYDSTTVTGEAVLSEARRLVEPLSASLFNDAIEQARQVPIGDPLYEQAQADILRWSQVILDLAEGRAAAGNFDGAIAAARLVPEDQPEVYAQAQTQIQRWQQRQVNRQLLQQAQALLQPDQATSFKDAIALVQQIPPDYPEYAVAQERIDQWSQDILVIARARAAAGDVAGAIAAAEKVPVATSAYDQAQQEIQRWQEP